MRLLRSLVFMAVIFVGVFFNSSSFAVYQPSCIADGPRDRETQILKALSDAQLVFLAEMLGFEKEILMRTDNRTGKEKQLVFYKVSYLVIDPIKGVKAKDIVDVWYYAGVKEYALENNLQSGGRRLVNAVKHPDGLLYPGDWRIGRCFVIKDVTYDEIRAVRKTKIEQLILYLMILAIPFVFAWFFYELFSRKRINGRAG